MEKEKERLNTRLFSELVAMTFFIAVSDLLIQVLYGRSFQELLIALILLSVTLVTGIRLYFQKAVHMTQRPHIHKHTNIYILKLVFCFGDRPVGLPRFTA